MILEEFDANRQAIINPQDLHKPIEGFPQEPFVSIWNALQWQL